MRALGPAVSHEPHVPVHQRFAEQAARQPDAVAVIDDGGETTYGALDRRANRIANMLLAEGIGRGERVGVRLERSADLVAALLGVGLWLSLMPEGKPPAAPDPNDPAAAAAAADAPKEEAAEGEKKEEAAEGAKEEKAE